MKTDTTWQPIETAPKDGTRILMTNKNRALSIGRWVTPGRFYRKYEGWSVNLTNPSHWMQLPEPPNDE